MSTSSLLKTVVFRCRRESNRVIWGMFSCYNCSELFRLLYVLGNLVYLWLQTDMILIHHAMHIYATPLMYLVSKDCNRSLSERARLSLTLLPSECFPSLWVLYLLPVWVCESGNRGGGLLFSSFFFLVWSVTGRPNLSHLPSLLCSPAHPFDFTSLWFTRCCPLPLRCCACKPWKALARVCCTCHCPFFGSRYRFTASPLLPL